MAGTGKTTIAYTLCRQLDENQRLAASFFCSRAFPECRNTKLIIPTIAYQLARFSHPFKLALLDVLDEDPDVHTCLPHAQFTALIVKPLTKSRDSLPLDIVVVVDALDECDDKDGTRCILEILLTQALGLPIKFFLSSRPEPAIRDEMSKPAADQASSRLVLHELEKNNVQMDIKTYMKAALAMVSPTNQQIATLVERSGILFIYAATVVRFIAHDGFRQNPQRRLGVVLNMSSTSKNQHKELDNLYTTILRAALDDSALEDVEKEDMKQVLYTVLCAQEPLSIPHLSRLLRLDSEYRVDAALRPLRSVLHVQEASKLVTVLHVSFVEYMLDSTRSLGYHCDSGLHNHVITKLCFECIQETRPRFNICRLESSYVRDDEVEDIEARVTKAISAELFYSCQYWATHLTASKGSTYLAMPLENFLRNHLLLWIEVMNLKRCIHKGPEALHKALRWGQHLGCSNDLLDLAHDAWRFTMTIALNLIRQSTPHIYVSALVFWPRSYPISKYYAVRTNNMIKLSGTTRVGRQQSLLAKWKYDAPVRSGAFSPGGNQLALSVGNEIHIVDAFSGHKMFDPLIGHANHVDILSIVFSPDGTRIASGARDKTVRIWDACSGWPLLDPFEHPEPVPSVDFSPDGTSLVSGSEDAVIRVWDVQCGLLLGSYHGHTEKVTSAKYSPKGTCIVSSSDDNTVCVWNTQSGLLVLGPLEGPSESVQSIAWSPDGTHIAFGCDNATICTWGIRDGQILLQQQYISGMDINSIEYSPDGACIAATTDNHAFIIDGHNGQMIFSLDLLEAHKDFISFFRFSPDGTRAMSGSGDRHVCVWDIYSQLLRRRQHKHCIVEVPSFEYSAAGAHNTLGYNHETQCVDAVKFWPGENRTSPDGIGGALNIWDSQGEQMALGPHMGNIDNAILAESCPEDTRAASDSTDTAIWVWDTCNGQQTSELPKGHQDGITVVQFSPDGTNIVSGSLDRTICIWDTGNGRLILGPLHGHTEWVECVKVPTHPTVDGLHRAPTTVLCAYGMLETGNWFLAH
ncbi:hypothetical protein RSAG8_08564, partial [Rhizoctonia solani AG-8 WAC10335]